VGTTAGIGVALGAGVSLGVGVSLGLGDSVTTGVSLGAGVSVRVGESLGLGATVTMGESLGLGAGADGSAPQAADADPATMTRLNRMDAPRRLTRDDVMPFVLPGRVALPHADARSIDRLWANVAGTSDGDTGPLRN
jgi:hypothetical protein